MISGARFQELFSGSPQTENCASNSAIYHNGHLKSCIEAAGESQLLQNDLPADNADCEDCGSRLFRTRG
jgi:hypothetical protein